MSGKAFVNIKSGAVEAANFEFKDVETAKPTGRFIVVKNISAAVNPVDGKVVAYGADFATKAGSDVNVVVGYDGYGVVTAVGDDVENFKVGDKAYYAGHLGVSGSFAEYTQVDERIVGKAPTKVDEKYIATVPLTVLTAWESFVASGLDTSKTEGNAAKKVLVINGAGGVGSCAIQLAKKVFGVGTVVATASRDATVAWCKDMGADHVINHREPFAPQVEKLGLGGFDVILCLVDLEIHYNDNILPVLNPCGALATITGDWSKIDVAPLFFKSQRLVFELMYTRIIFNKNPETQGAILNRVAQLLDDGTIKHWANEKQVFPFSAEGLIDAMKLQDSGKAIGKIAITF